MNKKLQSKKMKEYEKSLKKREQKKLPLDIFLINTMTSPNKILLFPICDFENQSRRVDSLSNMNTLSSENSTNALSLNFIS